MTIENVAVLFTDMVGSTALASSLPAEEADEVRRGHFSVLRQAVAEVGGTEVKNLGDGLMVVFSSTSAALSCAVAMQQGVDQDGRRRGRAVGLRVGLSVGEVSVEDGDYFGDPVIEAARLCARCEAGQVLAADVVRAMAGRRSRHECTPVGPVELKGLPDPVEVVEVVWEPLGGMDTNAVSLPGRLEERPGSSVVGRATETATLAAAAKRVAAGDGREVVLVSGEAGLGKTTLVADSARAAFDDGACVLFGHCEEDLAAPYQLFAEALGHYVAHAPEDILTAHVAEHGAELAGLVPALARRLPDLPLSKATDRDSERYLLFAAVVGLFEAVSKHQSVVLVLDDLQWADRASLQLLGHVAASERPLRVLVLGTYRDSELARMHPLVDTLARLRRHQGVTRIGLTGLDDTGVVELMEAAAGHVLDDSAVGLAHALHRETDGNPFFVTEVLRHLTETGAIVQDATGHWVAEDREQPMALPDGVREVIGARVARLGPAAERVLSTAAVIGRDFELDVLGAATATSEDELLDILDDAAAAALVRETADAPGRYSFAHALIQHTLYEDLGLTRRARSHRIIAETLEGLCGDRPGERAGELARHWSNATRPIDLGKAIAYSHQAADAALASLAPADALGYYARALDLLTQHDDGDPTLALDLAIGLGTAQRQTGDPAFRDTLLDAARRSIALDDTNRLVAAALANNRGFVTNVTSVDADKIAILETALDRLSKPEPDRALLLAFLCQELTFGSSLERRQALADEAIAIAQASDDDATIVRVLNDVHLPLAVPCLLEQSLDRSHDAMVRAERIGDPALQYVTLVWRTHASARAGHFAEVDRYLGILGSLADRLDQPTFAWWHVMVRCWRALVEGNTDQAEQLAMEDLQLAAESGQPDAETFFNGQLIEVSRQRGTLPELLPLIEQAAADNPGLWIFSAYLAIARSDAGRLEQARTLLERLAATSFDIPRDISWLTSMSLYAETAIECRAPEHATTLLERLAPWADQLCTNGVTAEGPVSHYLGGLSALLGRYDDADAYFTQAADFNGRVGAKFGAARTHLWWGSMLAQRGEPDDEEQARELLSEAHSVASANGYAQIERRAAEALRGLE